MNELDKRFRKVIGELTNYIDMNGCEKLQKFVSELNKFRSENDSEAIKEFCDVIINHINKQIKMKEDQA